MHLPVGPCPLCGSLDHILAARGPGRGHCVYFSTDGLSEPLLGPSNKKKTKTISRNCLHTSPGALLTPVSSGSSGRLGQHLSCHLWVHSHSRDNRQGMAAVVTNSSSFPDGTTAQAPRCQASIPQDAEGSHTTSSLAGTESRCWDHLPHMFGKPHTEKRPEGEWGAAATRARVSSLTCSWAACLEMGTAHGGVGSPTLPGQALLCPWNFPLP